LDQTRLPEGKKISPKTTTIPEGWVTETLAPAMKTKSSQDQAEDENAHPAPVVHDEALFTRRLEPFPQPKTIPSGWDLSMM
jgi:uncharacterized protein YbdZ (MbtH family)